MLHSSLHVCFYTQSLGWVLTHFPQKHHYTTAWLRAYFPQLQRSHWMTMSLRNLPRTWMVASVHRFCTCYRKPPAVQEEVRTRRPFDTVCLVTQTRIPMKVKHCTHFWSCTQMLSIFVKEWRIVNSNSILFRSLKRMRWIHKALPGLAKGRRHSIWYSCISWNYQYFWTNKFLLSRYYSVATHLTDNTQPPVGFNYLMN